jgi:hypothetical protein
VRIQVGFRDRVLAVGTAAPGGEVRWQGPGKDQVAYTADYYREHHRVGGDDLLGLMVRRMNGMWWAEPIADTPDDSLPQTAPFARAPEDADLVLEEEIAGLTREELLGILFDAGVEAGDPAEDAPFYDPSQPRHPAGSPQGGRWVGGVGTATQNARDAAHQAVRDFAAGKGPPTARDAHAVALHLAKLTVAQVHALKKDLGIKASGADKAALVAKVAQRIRALRAASPVPAAAPAPVPAPAAAPAPSGPNPDALAGRIPVGAAAGTNPAHLARSYGLPEDFYTDARRVVHGTGGYGEIRGAVHVNEKYDPEGKVAAALDARDRTAKRGDLTGARRRFHEEQVREALAQAVARAAGTAPPPPPAATPESPASAPIPGTISVSPARYAKGQVAVRIEPAPDGFKTRAHRLADAIGGRRSGREKAHIMSPAKAARLQSLYASGWDANSYNGELEPPPGAAAPEKAAPPAGANDAVLRGMAALARSEASLREGEPVSLGELRARLGLPKADFDAAVLGLADRGVLNLQRDNSPGLRSAAELADRVSDGAGNHFVSASLREGAALPGTAPEKVAPATPPPGPSGHAALAAAVADKVLELAPQSRDGLVPIHEVRRQVPAADRAAFDDAVRQLWREGKVRLVPLSDLSKATRQQLADGIPGVNETFFYLEPTGK